MSKLPNNPLDIRPDPHDMQDGDLVIWNEGGKFNCRVAESLISGEKIVTLFGHDPIGNRCNQLFFVSVRYFKENFTRDM